MIAKNTEFSRIVPRLILSNIVHKLAVQIVWQIELQLDQI